MRRVENDCPESDQGRSGVHSGAGECVPRLWPPLWFVPLGLLAFVSVGLPLLVGLLS